MSRRLKLLLLLVVIAMLPRLLCALPFILSGRWS